VRANGKIVAGAGCAWLKKSNVEVQSGNTVVVPLDAGEMRPLPIWTVVTSMS
jgi:hypothetical protein